LPPARINTVNLKNRLCDVETDRRNRLHVLPPPNRGGLNSHHSHGTHLPVEEPSTASRADTATTPRCINRSCRYVARSKGADGFAMLARTKSIGSCDVGRQISAGDSAATNRRRPEQTSPVVRMGDAEVRNGAQDRREFPFFVAARRPRRGGSSWFQH
jgi:hypothetical protein